MQLVSVKDSAPVNELEIGKAKGEAVGRVLAAAQCAGKAPLAHAGSESVLHGQGCAAQRLRALGWQKVMESANRQTSKASNSAFLNKPPEGQLELASDCVLMSECCLLLPHR